MSDYQCVRLWQVRVDASNSDVETLASTGVREMQSWIPGVTRLQLLRLQGESRRYLMTLTFKDDEAYRYWRQVEEEAPNYWERYAAVMAQWEQLCELVAEYVGESILDAPIGTRV